jgi:hypothetical protein
MRDFVAGLVAVALVFLALSLSTTLHFARRHRQRLRNAELQAGRRIVAEIPGEEDLILFTQDASSFHYGTRAIPKDVIVAVRVLINGSPIAAYVSQRHPEAAETHPTTFEDRPEGIARDRWDVAIETTQGTTLIECGAIRERVSQELARAVFDAVKGDLEARDATRGRGSQLG